MLKDAKGFNHIYLATGKTDLRYGVRGLLVTIKGEFDLDPFEAGDIFLFCGGKWNTIKALVLEDDGFVLMTKKLFDGRYQWPRDSREAKEIDEKQFKDLMEGFAIEYRSSIKKVRPLYV